MLRISLILSVLLLSGCSLTGSDVDPVEQIVVTNQTAQPEIYQPPFPREIKLEEVEFFVITEHNLEEKKKEIERITGGDFVVFAILPQSYENLSYNVQELKRYILQQKEIILYYRNVTATEVNEVNGDTDSTQK